MEHTTKFVEEIDVNKLIPYANNAKTHSEDQIRKLQASLTEFGFINPILVDQKYNIIAGHGRLEAAIREGMDPVPCVVIDHLSDAQKRAYILADNRLAEDAGWDMEMLKLELSALQALDFDLSPIGFEDNELCEFLSSPQAEEDNYEPVLPEIPKAKPGDIYQLGRHRLMCGDSTDPDHVAKLMDGRRADLIFTDPPWNVNYGSDQNHPSWKPRTIMNDAMETEEFKDFMDRAFYCMRESSKPGCMTYVVMSAQEWGSLMATMAENGYHWSSTIIWNKDSFVLSRKDYHTKYEPIWYGWLDGDARLCPLADRKQCDVWDIPRPKASPEHPTMKPVPLVGQAIENSSGKGDVVLDLFGGSGTTLIASEQLDRNCRMMELDPAYVDVILDRWEKLTGEKAIRIN